MRHFFSFLTVALLSFGPGQLHADDVALVDKDAVKSLGTYVGFFGDEKITVCLDRIVGNSVTGYSIVMSNQRAFSGKFDAVEGGYKFELSEPGDHKDDGSFVLEFNGKEKTLTGAWAPLSGKNKPVPLTLTRRDFQYNAKAGEYPQSSSRKLKEADVENLRPDELRIMRNEIYARHGYMFLLEDMRKHFNGQEWYMAISQNIKDSLTDTEKANEALIKRYENYSAEYYDSFGR